MRSKRPNECSSLKENLSNEEKKRDVEDVRKPSKFKQWYLLLDKSSSKQDEESEPEIEKKKEEDKKVDEEVKKEEEMNE